MMQTLEIRRWLTVLCLVATSVLLSACGGAPRPATDTLDDIEKRDEGVGTSGGADGSDEVKNEALTESDGTSDAPREGEAADTYQLPPDDAEGADSPSAEDQPPAAPPQEPVSVHSDVESGGLQLEPERPGDGGWAKQRALDELRSARKALNQALDAAGGSFADKRAQAGGCGRTCELADAICSSRDAICEVARTYDEARVDCRWAERECNAARAQCSACGGG